MSEKRISNLFLNISRTCELREIRFFFGHTPVANYPWITYYAMHSK